jgi:hypothetical protein
MRSLNLRLILNQIITLLLPYRKDQPDRFASPEGRWRGTTGREDRSNNIKRPIDDRGNNKRRPDDGFPFGRSSGFYPDNYGDRSRVASVSPMPSSVVAARSSLRNAALRLADAAHSGGGGTPRSPDASSSSEDVSFPFDELGIGEPKAIPLEPVYSRLQHNRPVPPPTEPRSSIQPKSIPLEPKYPPLQLFSSRHSSTEPKSIPLERSSSSGGIDSFSCPRPVRELADSPQERQPPVLKSRWTPLIITPESPPPAVEESPASPDTQTVSPQVPVHGFYKYGTGTVVPCTVLRIRDVYPGSRIRPFLSSRIRIPDPT